MVVKSSRKIVGFASDIFFHPKHNYFLDNIDIGLGEYSAKEVVKMNRD